MATQMASFNENIWTKGLFGIEKENIRVNGVGQLAHTSHPVVFGDKKSHPYITTDFSESQVEMITPPQTSIADALGFLETIHDIVSLQLVDEYLWPQSIPPLLPSSGKMIPIARYRKKNAKEEAYRKYLSDKYGRKKQTISGVHFNVSFSDELLAMLYRENASEISYEEFKNNMYLKVARQLLRYRWLYVLIFGCSPVLDTTSDNSCRGISSIRFKTNENALSLRNSCFGYGNSIELFPDYGSLADYHESISKMIDAGQLFSPKELYSPVRLKFLQSNDAVSYLEIRFVDINPLVKTGVSSEMLHFLHCLAIYGLVADEPDSFGVEEQRQANQNYNTVSIFGLEKNISLQSSNGTTVDAWNEALKMIQEMQQTFKNLTIQEPSYNETLQYVSEMIANPERRTVHQLLQQIDEKGYVSFHLEKAREYLQQSRNRSYRFSGLDDMELSTQLLLREAVRRGVRFDIIDRTDNFVRLERNGIIQYVKQATMTSLDNYASVLAMENKLVTKHILSRHGIRVPNGTLYSKASSAKHDFMRYHNRAIVIKPKLTNFGVGISILKVNDNEENFYRAVDMAFECDSTVLIEEFVAGKEFRFFVVDSKVVGILHRIPANVLGNGYSTIRQLVAEKNKNPLRGKGYKTPLELINLGAVEEMFLAQQGKSFDYVPQENETVFLRENSNISTGGDSVDYTDLIPESYKLIAVKAARALQVKITGIDMIIADYTNPATDNNHAIIEMNFNPAIHIHCHPFSGKSRMINENILDALGFVLEEENNNCCALPLANYVRKCC